MPCWSWWYCLFKLVHEVLSRCLTTIFYTTETGNASNSYSLFFSSFPVFCVVLVFNILFIYYKNILACHELYDMDKWCSDCKQVWHGLYTCRILMLGDTLLCLVLLTVTFMSMSLVVQSGRGMRRLPKQRPPEALQPLWTCPCKKPGNIC